MFHKCKIIEVFNFLIFFFLDLEAPLSSEESILTGQYEKVLNEFYEFSSISLNEHIELNIKEKIENSKIDIKEWFCMGIASLLYFIQNNFVGSINKQDISCLLALRKFAIAQLALNDQLNENVVKPELLLVAKIIFRNEKIKLNFSSVTWWLFRANFIHQLILDEASAFLFEESERFIDKLCDSCKIDDATEFKVLFCTEVSQFYLYYHRTQSSEKYLKDAKLTAKLNFELTGALGKRTKYQSQEKPQLYLTVQIDKALYPFRECNALPKVINLSDDVLLENVEFTQEKEKINLGSFEEAVIISEL